MPYVYTLSFSSRFLLMSLLSPTWPQRDKAPCSGTFAGLTPTSSSDSDSGCALEEYLEATADAAPAEVSLGFEAPSADTVPAAIRSQLRIKSLLQQLPPQDCNDRYCPGLGEEERRQLQAFSARRRQESLGQGFACLVPSACLCEKCGRRLNTGDLGVFASRLGDRSCWHPSCFVCHSCHQPLVDLIYFHQDGKIYCGRHHAEFFRPRCSACDQLIFTDECTEAEGRRWHTEHFCCLECDLPLGGQRYVMKGGRLCCCSCFESLYAELCQACGELIEMEDSPDQASTCPTFRSQDGHRTAFKEGSKGTPYPSALAQADAAPTGQEQSSTTLPSELGLNGPGALGDQLPGRLRPQPGGGALHFRIGSSTNPNVATRQSPVPSLTDTRPPDVMEEEDSWCPTCSSSSDSEPEGFFFGKPIPKAVPALPSREQSGLGRAAGRSKHLARLRSSRKHCSIS
ncbi:prickle-like protein 4 isoform X3 [Gopherus evgoodei]|uniref:prickle-like protein 4 isoform X3 n=1 Tax=Gopherus evgoodei TaxID=1825980 RepID=UPI0011CF0074|nr:prickle-like protein 4 isoform X3 [Gopherus evgoodei]